MRKEDSLGFIIIKFYFVTTVQEFDCMLCFLEAGVKRLRRHGLGLFLSTTHAMEKTITSSNRVSIGSKLIKEGVAYPVEGIWLVCFIIIF